MRMATAADAVALRDLERDANLVALGHVFPPDRFPFPDDEILARWRVVLAEPGVQVLVEEDDRGLTCFVAFDSTTVRHLAVRPDVWGTGLARAALAAAEEHGHPQRLWCLRDNHRAIGLYEHLGWRRTGREQPAEWPPYPVELEFAPPTHPDRPSGA
jgi:putative acetyltransferase